MKKAIANTSRLWYGEGAMKQKVVVGGFASDQKQIEHVALDLSEYYDEDVIGMNFRKAMQTSRAFFDGRELITHSAGFRAVWGALPERITAIAPPVPEAIHKLMWRGFVMGRKLSSHQEKPGQDADGNLLEELLHHPRTHLGVLSSISHFDALLEASWYQKHDVPTTVVFMKSDRLFRLGTQAVRDSITSARRIDVDVVTAFGDHSRFTHDPIGLLADLALSQSLAVAA